MPPSVPSSQPRAAIIIPHYNDLARLTRCLAALAPQVLVRADIECVVVDNNSPPEQSPTALLDQHGWARLVTEPRKGAAEARNRGVAETTAPILVFLDCDCVPDTIWLETALQLAEQGDLVGGRIDTFDETPPPRSGAEAFETAFAFKQRSYIEQKGFSVTANLVTRRDVFDAVGPFVAGLSEDLDWCHRAVAQGFSLVYADAMGVSHPTRSDWQALRRKWLRLTQESFALGLSDGVVPLSVRAKWAVRAMAVLGSALAHSPKVLGASELVGWTEKRRALGMLWWLRGVRAAWMLRQAIGLPIS